MPLRSLSQSIRVVTQYTQLAMGYQAFHKLQEVDAILADGKTAGQVRQTLEVSEQTFRVGATSTAG